MPDHFVLLDQPDDSFCEARGWVETSATEDEARKLLAPFCGEDPPDPPVGPGKRIWLAPAPVPYEEDPRWFPCDPDKPGAREFWEFDTTETEKLASA